MAEERIKRVMLDLIHHDALANPTPTQQGKPDEAMTPECRQLCHVPKGHKVANQDKLVKYIAQHPIIDVEPEYVEGARKLIEEESEVVR